GESPVAPHPGATMPTRREALKPAAATLAAALPGAAAAQEAPKKVHFSGYNWLVRNTTAAEGPGPNLFSDTNVSVVNGRLHLKITRNAADHAIDQWTCAEGTMAHRPLGYGTYRVTVATPPDELPEDVTLGLVTWSDTNQQNLGEIDVERARWGNADSVTNSQFVVQPFDLTDGRLVRFAAPAPQPGKGLPMVYEFDWQPTGIRFKASTAAGRLVSSWFF